MTRRLLGVVSLALVFAGCDDPDSEEGQLAFSDPEFSRDHNSGDRVLSGTSYCPSFSAWFDEEGSHSPAGDDEQGTLRDCFSGALTGPGTLAADGCITFDDVGEVVWELQPQDCQLAGDEGITFAPDRVRFASVAIEDVTAVVSPWRECFALEDLEPDPADAYSDAWVPDLDVPVLVAADQPFDLDLALAGVDACDEVGWSMRGASHSGEAAGAEVEPGDDVRNVIVTVEAGAELDLALHLPDLGDFPASRIQGIALEAIATLDLVALYKSEGDSRAPLAVRGIARDADGNLVRAAPIEWSLDEGRLALSDEDVGPEYTLAEDACVAPGASQETRSARVTGRLGDLEASVDLTWTAAPGSAESFEPDERCPAGEQQGCGCGVVGERSGVPALFGLWLLVRRRSPRYPSSQEKSPPKTT